MIYHYMFSPKKTLVILSFLGNLVSRTSQADTPDKFFAPLEDVKTAAPWQPIGGQNFSRCCLNAVDSWRHGNTAITIQSSKNPDQLFTSAEQFSSSGEQFPCGATYDGHEDGAPQVFITYDWCNSNCGGWQKSVNRVLSQWVQPFVGFILPAAVFCLNVPRKMVFDISDDLFPNVLESLKGSVLNLIEYQKQEGATAGGYVGAMLGLLFDVLLDILKIAFRAGVAAALGIVNVVVWVTVVFSTAAPMILSGLYEAAVDRQVLHTIEREVRGWKRQRRGDTEAANDMARVKYQVHLLYAVLVGNLQLWKHQNMVKVVDNSKDLESCAEYDAAWRNVKELIEETLDTEDARDRESTKTRLKTMLECQASFGATIGAPIAFFLGSFLLSVFSNLTTLGDNDTSHAVAFGEWWMIIPHVAIVSGCLLAGNNPNTLEAIVSGLLKSRGVEHKQTESDKAETSRKSDVGVLRTSREEVEVTPGDVVASPNDNDSKGRQSIRQGVKNSYSPFYKESAYQPVWMWERGRSKRNWIQAVQDVDSYKAAQISQIAERHPRRTPHINVDDKSIRGRLVRVWAVSRAQHPLKDLPILGAIGWASLVLTASILVIIPWVLAYVTSYYTPTIGLSCRSFTFVVYFLFQLCLTAIWAFDFHNKEHRPLYTPKGWPTPFFAFTVFSFCGSAFTTIAGTFLQILGVYRNCKCSVPLWAWNSPDFRFIISSNSAEMIYYARLYWLSTGVASIVLLIFFCYLGWWYQRHWRLRFKKVVDDVLMTTRERETRTFKAKKTEKSKGPGTGGVTTAAPEVRGNSQDKSPATDSPQQGISTKAPIADEITEA